MKALVKSMVAVVFMFVGSLAIQAVTPKTYMYDTKEENGKIISKVVYAKENNLLSREMKFEFTYNEAGKVAEKKAYRWNASREDWTPVYLISYDYDTESGDIISNYGLWDAQKKDFSLNSKQLLMPASAYDTIFS